MQRQRAKEKVTRRKERLTFRIVRKSRHIEREMEFGIEFGKQCERRFPLIGLLSKIDGLEFAFSAAVSPLLLGVVAVDTGTGQINISF